MRPPKINRTPGLVLLFDGFESELAAVRPDAVCATSSELAACLSRFVSR